MNTKAYIDKESWPYRRYTLRPDGAERIDIFTFGATGVTIFGTPARGHFKHYGYRKDGKFSRTLRGLKQKLNALQ
jgi:hypothetical protein